MVSEIMKKEQKTITNIYGYTRVKEKVWKDIPYVTAADIKKIHGKEWFKKFNKVFGNSNTCPIIKENGKNICGIYYWDYERFANLVDFQKPTYWD